MAAQQPLVIDVKGVCKQYSGRNVVNHVDLQVKRGEIYGFLGPNGSGKTTTIRMICGLLRADEGEGQCLGYDIRTEPEKIKCEVGYMTQHFSLYKELTVYENLNFIARMYRVDRRKERVEKAIAQLGIGRDRSKQLAKHLSGGWKQRLALAAAVLHDPKLLLLDEPTAGVDPKARRDFWDEIYRLSDQGVTTLVSTHYMDEAERCHRIAYIVYGDLLVKGTQQEVIESAGIETWEVSGDGLDILAKTLRENPRLTQVSPFGQRLHISAPLENHVGDVLQPYRHQPGYAWQEISPSLEDVFIHFMQQKKDNFS